MGNAVSDQNLQLTYLKTRLNMFLEVLEALHPETAELEDIDRLIQMIDDLEMKYERFKKDWEKSR
ncbi:MAG: SE1561 family protein [Anoxybacillus gonensis]|nr:SE1561 family protein [Anoxybacillus gonensis]